MERGDMWLLLCSVGLWTFIKPKTYFLSLTYAFKIEGERSEEMEKSLNNSHDNNFLLKADHLMEQL